MYRFVALLALLSFFSPGSFGASRADQPNIIVILIDDLGYADVGAYNKRIDFTPNIDKLAKGGMLFSDFHSNGPMCSPTRAALLTGLYQYRFGERFEKALSADSHEKGVPVGVPTIGSILKQAGYTTGLFGKWHLGVKAPYLPGNYGFDKFVGLLSGDGDHHTHINRWGMEDWWNDQDLKMEKGYSTRLITNHSIRFIKENKEKPFFLLISHLAIHFPWQGPADPPHRKAGQRYPNDKWGIIPDPANVRTHVVEMIKDVDRGIGEIMRTLESFHLTENTLIVFTSDNGGYTHYYQGEHRFENISDNGPFRGQKAEVFEGGHRVPCIMYWPGSIKKGQQTAFTGMTMDLLPTFIELAGAEAPNDYRGDGMSLVPLIKKTAIDAVSDRYLFWKIGDDWAVRKGNWKIVGDKEGCYLYNLADDIGESRDLANARPEIVKEFSEQYRKWAAEMNLSVQKWDR